MILAKVVGILRCVKPSQMSSTAMPPSAQTTQTTLSHFWTARTTCWYQQPTWIVRRSQLCCRMGQCQLPSCSPGPKLVCFPPPMSSSAPSTLHSISQCHQRAVQGWIQHCRLYSPCRLAMEHIAFFFLFECYFFVSTCSKLSPNPPVYDDCIWQSISVLFL